MPFITVSPVFFVMIISRISETESIERTFYQPTDGMNCSSTQDAGSLQLMSCAFLCTQMDEVCAGFGYDHSQGACQLCLIGCLNSPKPVTFSYGFVQYSISPYIEDWHDGEKLFTYIHYYICYHPYTSHLVEFCIFAGDVTKIVQLKWENYTQ